MERIIEIADHGGPDGWHSYSFGEAREHIVRCRDCKHFCEDRRDTANGWVDVFVCYSEQWSTVSLMPSHEIEPDGFCAWGERKAVG